MADQSGGSSSVAAMTPPPTGIREYRKGNWTLQETMILIEAKKMDDERRLKKSPQQLTFSSNETTTPGSSSNTSQQQEQMMTMMQTRTTTTTTSKPVTELRWKWVEEYCWRRGCFRSQNQCNDKWDNLMRDYKKVRDYQRNLINNATQSQQGLQSYWNMEKTERKERNLSSNMLPTIYDSLLQVADSKPPSSSPSSASAPPLPAITTTTTTTTTGALSLLLQQQQVNVAALTQPPPPQFSPHQPMITPALSTIPGDHGMLLDSDTSSGSSAKRRRKEKRPATAAGVRVGTSTCSKNETSDIANAMCKIIETIQESDKRQEERHREMVMLKQRRLQIEEARIEVNKQEMNGLVDAVNNLASSILALAAANNSGNAHH